MKYRDLFKQTFDAVHASEDTVTEVMKMAKSNIPYKSNRSRSLYRTILIAAAMAALLATAAFAAGIFGLRAEPVGQYGMKISADYRDDKAADGTIAFTGGDPSLTHALNVTPTYLPEGMENVVGETMKFWFKDSHHRGFSIMQHLLNTGDSTFSWVERNVRSQESITVSGHEAVWLEHLSGDDKLYISCPEYNVVLEILFFDMDKDAAQRIAKGLTFEDSGYTLYPDPVEVIIDTPSGDPSVDADGWIHDPEGDGYVGYKYSISRAEMKTYDIGETVSACFAAVDPIFIETSLPVTVTDVAVSDDLSALTDPSLADSDLTGMLDENGKLPVCTVGYFQEGDGINTPSSTMVSSREEQTMLVTATMDIANNTGEDFQGLNFFFVLSSIMEDGDSYVPYVPAPPDNTPYDYMGALVRGVDGGREMCYYSVHGKGIGNGSNYIDYLPAGETVTLQIGWLVTEDQLPYLYLNMDGPSSGGPYDISRFYRSAVDAGYIRLSD